jgi:phosphinothricin acetyltransferase
MRVSLRRASELDAAACAALYAPYVRETCVTFELAAPAADEMQRRIREHTTFAPWLVAERSDGGRSELLGYAYGSRFRARPAYDWTVEVTVYVAATAQRLGVGRALYEALLEWLRLQGFRTALAVIGLPNAPSVALHEALGFQPIGVFRDTGFKHGAWRDTGWWQLALGDTSGEPTPTRSLEVVAASEAGRAALTRAACAIRAGPTGGLEATGATDPRDRT